MYDGKWREAIVGYDLVMSSWADEIDPTFAIYYVLGASAQQYFRSQRDRSAQPHLNSRQLGNMPIPLPEAKEQRAIAATLGACDAKIEALGRETTLLDELFRAMLEELMSGRLSAVPLIEQEAAS
jgi:type I restriction enzyme S subunit